MNNRYINKIINIREQNDSSEPCLIANNEKQITDICDFLMSDKKFFLMNGFTGTGKTSVVNYVCNHLFKNVLTIKYTCFETTTLDDMLLSFFDSFRSYVIAGKLVLPKLRVENFTQKVNMYFESTSLPILVVINSFESLLKNNKASILNFLKHISKYKNVKIIITSRVFTEQDFEGVDIDGTTVLAFSKEIFEKYLKDNEIKNIGVLSNELYKQTKGYYGYVKMSVIVMKLRGYNLVKFLEVHSKSLLSFSDFIIREMLNFVDPVSLHLFRLLAVMRIPIHFNLLKSLHLYNQGQINFFLENILLGLEGESIYLPDYYRDLIEHQIQDSVMLKLHKACVELYETQLPLKPLERDLRLSRQTIRNEIDYHSLFLPKKRPVTEDIRIQYIDNSRKKIEKEVVQETKEEKIEKINFIIEDENLLNDIAGSIKDFVKEKKEENEIALSSTNLTLLQLLNSAKEEEIKYNYKNAILLYQGALTKKDDDDFDKFLPVIYVKLAKVYKHLSQWYEALEYFTKAQDFYYNAGQKDKADYIKLEIANIYFALYKQDNAKYLLNELENDYSIPNDLRIRVNLSLAKVCGNIEESYSYLCEAIPLIDYTTDKKIASELYYRFAVINDEKDNLGVSVQYYKKCVEVDTDYKNNQYISKALSNLAQICDDNGSSESAIYYYQKSMEIDLNLKNYNGLYYSARNLSEIYSSRDEGKSLEYLNKALEYAKQLNEPYYLIDTSMEIGNYYLVRKNLDSAYQYVNSAYEIAKSSFSQENTQKISERLEYIKSLINKENE